LQRWRRQVRVRDGDRRIVEFIQQQVVLRRRESRRQVAQVSVVLARHHGARQTLAARLDHRRRIRRRNRKLHAERAQTHASQDLACDRT